MEYGYIAIEGNIGVGKTTLATLISKELGRTLILEQFEDNHFLPLFYKNRKKYAFHTELSFLIQRFEQLQKAKLSGDKIIADYYFMKTLIFARNNLSNLEFDLFLKLYHNLKASIPKPDLIIFLRRKKETLLDNIHSRGRDFETNISLKYLSEIENAYQHHIEKEKDELTIVSLDVENIDFVNFL
ncbi:deoxynucleoside kinase [Mucilaginibacter ginsenosidivorans]|uniref:Deoxynucleoside kinase n=1 Tax=Mucilaginibacter ginsenosidivorans TaxID=398053 RepID=A0A5B8UXD7_9SPHI|nr:deoxynucleoside kinase [Mucilaginibacter ginsenosidivorans]QEC63056.1 deoxynucleoside kinase [Mucilaginibacter ginsenosidivorans]